MNMCLADEASSVFNSEGKTWKDCVTIEVQLNCHPRVWSPLMCVMALSFVIGAPIVSIYPENGQSGLEKLFDCRILPRIETPGVAKRWLSYVPDLITWTIHRIVRISQTASYFCFFYPKQQMKI